MNKAKKQKVAIVCDWLIGTGGAERVVLELHKLYPDAPIYTSQYDNSSKIWYNDDWFGNADVRTLWLQKLPKSLRKFLPLFRAWAFSRLDLSDYDLVISSSGAEAKGVKTRSDTIHINYCHSPTHYYWVRYDEYLKNPGFGKLDFLARLGLRLLVKPLRLWDYRAAQRPDFIVANSTHTQAMIKKFYKRESTVIHPPVNIGRFKTKKEEIRSGFVVAGRQTPYKRIDLAVKACSELNVPLVVIGNGPEHKKLEKMAGRSVLFLTNVSDSEMPRHLQTAEAFIFPNMDDFGIIAVEALAAGTPVIAYEAGGVLDYVKQGRNGVFFGKQDVKSAIKAVEDFRSRSFDNQKVARSAEAFSEENFIKNIKEFIKKTIAA